MSEAAAAADAAVSVVRTSRWFRCMIYTFEMNVLKKHFVLFLLKVLKWRILMYVLS